MELPDFDRFEIEDCELISLGLENEGRDAVMKWTCPVRGWRWKRRVFKGLRAVFFPQSEFLAYAVELRCFQTARGRARLCMEFDEGAIEFEFADCIQREISMNEYV